MKSPLYRPINISNNAVRSHHSLKFNAMVPLVAAIYGPLITTATWAAQAAQSSIHKTPYIFNLTSLLRV